MSDSPLIAAIHASGRQLVLAVTGGGSGAISALLEVPGGSRSILEAVVPYADSALERWLGGAPPQACSAATARAMAMAAFMRARILAPQAEPEGLMGVGATASLATYRPKLGEHRIHVGVQTARETIFHSLLPTKGRRDRAEEEALASRLILWAIADVSGVDATPLYAEFDAHTTDEPIESQRERAPVACSELILGTRQCAVIPAGRVADHFDEASAPHSPIVFPGAFNPPHDGHLRMAAEAERRLGKPVTWELSVANVDKPPLDFFAMRQRVELLRGADPQRLIALTYAPTFREKARLFSQAVFVVGADTIIRVADLRYYGGDAARRDESVRQITERGCRFLVFGRQLDKRFLTLAELDLPPALRALCDEVPAADFHEDISSTELRNEG